MQRPPEYPEDDQHDEQNDDLAEKVYGPSQHDIDRSWDGYNTGSGSKRIGGLAWKLTIVVVSVVILASMSIGILGPLLDGSNTPQDTTPERVTASVLRVIDGRTIVVDAGNGEQTVRLIGVETPPFGDPFYDFARQVTDSWINGKQILLEADQRNGDEQGRLMRYVFVDDVMINAALILNGLATADTENPNIRYEGYFAAMERQARESGVGIWDASFGTESDTTDTQATDPTASRSGVDPS